MDGEFLSRDQLVDITECDFKEGVKFAEAKIEEIIIDFIIWLKDNGKYLSPKEKWKHFLKERNEKEL